MLILAVVYFHRCFNFVILICDCNDIDGATIRAVDLRSMFPLLPKNMKLPEKRDVEVK